MELSGLKKLIEAGRYDIPSDKVASALLENIKLLRALRDAGTLKGEITQPEAQPDEEPHSY